MSYENYLKGVLLSADPEVLDKSAEVEVEAQTIKKMFDRYREIRLHPLNSVFTNKKLANAVTVPAGLFDYISEYLRTTHGVLKLQSKLFIDNTNKVAFVSMEPYEFSDLVERYRAQIEAAHSAALEEVNALTEEMCFLDKLDSQEAS